MFGQLLGLAAAKPLEPRPRVRIDRIAEARAVGLAAQDRLELAEEGARALLAHLLPRGAAHREVGGDETDPLTVPVCRGEPFEQVSASVANRTASVPTSSSRPTPSQTSTPRAPRSATKLARASVSSRRSANAPAWRRL